MALYHPVSLKGSCAIAVCDRCNMKMSINDLRPDGNSPGLRVCKGCCDTKDPWRLPARKTENITLRYPRPDVPLIGLQEVLWQNNDALLVGWANDSNQQVSWESQ